MIILSNLFSKVTPVKTTKHTLTFAIDADYMRPLLIRECPALNVLDNELVGGRFVIRMKTNGVFGYVYTNGNGLSATKLDVAIFEPFNTDEEREASSNEYKLMQQDLMHKAAMYNILNDYYKEEFGIYYSTYRNEDGKLCHSIRVSDIDDPSIMEYLTELFERQVSLSIGDERAFTTLSILLSGVSVLDARSVIAKLDHF